MKTIKKSIVVFLVALLITPSLMAQSNNAKLHMIIFADTDDASIGKSVLLDYNKVSRLAKSISSKAGMKLKTYYHKGRSCNQEELEDVIKGMNVGSNDAIFFYYTGHGYRTKNSTSPFPRMLIFPRDNHEFSQSNQGYAVDDVREHLSASGARLTIVMVDACNIMVNLLEPGGVAGFKDAMQYKRLFLEAKGEVVMTGSKGGKEGTSYAGLSWGNPTYGGFFTFNFTKALKSVVKSNTPATWSRVLSLSKKMTIKFSKEALTSQPSDRNRQIPYYIDNTK